MRLFELVAPELAGVRRVVDVAPERPSAPDDEPAERVPPRLNLPEQVALESRPAGALQPDSVGTEDLLVAVLTAESTSKEITGVLEPVLRSLQEGAGAVLVVRAAPQELPLAQLVAALGRYKCQAVQAVALEDWRPGCGIVLRRSAAPLQVRLPFADSSTHAEPMPVEAMRRLVNEFVLGDHVSRWARQRVRALEGAEQQRDRLAARLTQVEAAMRSSQEERDQVQADLDRCRREAGRYRERLRAVEASGWVRVGRILSRLAADPVGAGSRLPGTVYRRLRGGRRRGP